MKKVVETEEERLTHLGQEGRAQERENTERERQRTDDAEQQENQTENLDEQTRRNAINQLKENCTEENLWNCIVAFQGYPFYTSSGLPFTYQLKIGRNGSFTKELFIDRRENSKSLAWSSVRLAFQKAMEMDGAVFSRPKEIADIRGVSYSYSLLWRFGVIRVPEKIEKNLSGHNVLG